MSPEARFIQSLRAIATTDAARGLLDDAAVLAVGGSRLVLTKDMLVEGVHFLASDPPESVAAKLVAVNVSDLVAKGAKPLAAMLGYMLGREQGWDTRFISGLKAALEACDLALIGGDTVSRATDDAPGVLSLTVIGEAGAVVPSRSGARDGDALFVTGTIGDAGVGLSLAKADPGGDHPLINAYRTPQPQLLAGQALASIVTAMMDVSDGLLIDVARMAEASDCAAMIDLDAVPLSFALIEHTGQDRAARLTAATAGDDYQLLFTANRPLPSIGVPVTRIGKMVPGHGLHLYDRAGPVPLPARLGWLHGLP